MDYEGYLYKLNCPDCHAIVAFDYKIIEQGVILKRITRKPHQVSNGRLRCVI